MTVTAAISHERTTTAGRRLRTPRKFAAIGRGLVSFGVLLVVWQISARLSGVPAYFYPRPMTVWHAAITMWQHGLIPDYVGASIVRWATGVGVGLAAAVPWALALAMSRTMRDMFLPIFNFFHAIVELAWIPLFVLWFGYSFLTIVISISYVVFFLVLYNTLVGIRQVPAATINATRTLGASRWQITREVLLPGALPGIVTGLRLGAGFGWRALIGAEMIAAHSGLGYLLFESRQDLLTGRTVVGMVLIGVLWLLMDRMYLRPFEAATVERWGMLRRAV